MAEAGKNLSRLLDALKGVGAKLPPELVEALGTSGSEKIARAIVASGAKFPGADLAQIAAAIDWAKIDPAAEVRKQLAKHPELFKDLFAGLLAKIEAADPPEPAAPIAVAADQHSTPVSEPPPAISGQIDLFRTGAAGRPTAVPIVLQEAERRINAGEIDPQLRKCADVAEELEKWWATERLGYNPRGPSVKAKTIYGKLLPFFRKPPSKPPA